VQKLKNNFEMANVNPVGWFDLNVANLDRAKNSMKQFSM
jgi:hypothetical protein